MLSKRLYTAASMVHPGNVLADVGTDHGYVPIYLVAEKIIPRAIAMDINRGPLERAREHIQKYGMGDYIETRISDGVTALAVNEADTILAAGMGGGLIMHILKEGGPVCRSAKELILQPQSELERVRLFLHKSGYVTEQEAFVEEDGKYYPMLRVRYDMAAAEKEPERTALRYGGLLLAHQDPVLEQYLKREQDLYTGILENLKRQPETEKLAKRIWEVREVLELNREALSYYH